MGKGEYFRFGMRDSLAIEASFLQVVYALVPNFCDLYVGISPLTWWFKFVCVEGGRVAFLLVERVCRV